MVEDSERTPLSLRGDAGSAAYPATASSPEGFAPPGDEPNGEPGANVRWDPVAVVAVVLVVLTLAVPAAVLGGWAVVRSAGDTVRTRRAWIVLGVALVEAVVGGLLWAVYFVWLAPVVTLPAG